MDFKSAEAKTMRYLKPFIEKDLSKKMVFLGGPRQCGKTTLARHILGQDPEAYLSWDDPDHHGRILKRRWASASRLVVFDELHKFPKWKSWIKGIYDSRPPGQSFLVTGSARLDLYQRGGDSLLGRYHYWRLHPFSLWEHAGGFDPPEALRRLLTVGGFPEPFLDGDEREARRWRRERYQRIVRDDIRDLEPLRSLPSLELLLSLLRERVSSTVTLSGLAREIQVAPQTVGNWIEILSRMYLIFVVRPYVENVARAVQKPFKVYFYDNLDVDCPEDRQSGARFENLVATHLLKKVQFLEDYTGEKWELSFLRDRDGREVDFVVVRNGVAEELVEAKCSGSDVARPLVHFAEKLNPAGAVQVVKDLRAPFSRGRLRVTDPITYFASPPWSA